MKKMLYLGGLFLTILLVAGFVSMKVNSNDERRTPTTFVECKPLFDKSAKVFALNARYNYLAVMVRKNVYSLSAAEITSIKNGITAMKALPITDPTSWLYQAAIHGTTTTPTKPSWNSCQHGTDFFLSWHRMYLYFFERILRAKSGNPNLTLPYWDYQTNPVLHADYRNSSAGNPLYSTRNASINSGGSLSNGPMVAIDNSLAKIPFYDFQSFLEGPHGSIHGAIGGDMSFITRSAKDPVFWLHHTNIDRLWAAWLRKCGGRANPPASDATWMNQTFTFFDETGAAVNMTGTQIINTSTQLNYRYDFPLKLPCNFNIDFSKWKLLKVPLIRLPEPVMVNHRKALLLKQGRSDGLETFARKEKREAITVSNENVTERLVVELQDVQIKKAPEGVIEVYVNLGPNEVPNPRNKNFIGVLDLFTHDGHMHDGGKAKSQRLDITDAAKSLGLKLSTLKNSQLTFIVRGNNVQGREKPTTADVQIRSMEFAIERFSKQ